MPQIILDDGTTFDVEFGKRLVLALEDSGVDILHRCGGFARCTTCRVQFAVGEPQRMTEAERDRLAENGLFGNYRLSCQIYCDQNMILKWIHRLSQSEYDMVGKRPEDRITPEAVWGKKPG